MSISDTPSGRSPSRFKIGVTGDTGYDIFTEFVEGFESSNPRLRKPESAFDAYVPSGANYISRALSYLLSPQSLDNPTTEAWTPPHNYEVHYLAPRAQLQKDGTLCREFSTHSKYLVELGRFARDDSDRAEVLRVKRACLIHDGYPPSEGNVFHELVDATPAGALSPASKTTKSAAGTEPG